jgi:hypothetical protein
MLNANRPTSILLVLLGAILGSLFTAAWEHSTVMAQQNNPEPTPATMQADLTRLKNIVPPASHPMVDVAMFAANLWFAAEKKDWPLANYFLGEMRNRMLWEVHLNPAPKGADGNPVDMAAIFDGIDKGSLSKVKQVIDSRDSKQFSPEYRHLLEDCYSCHKTANRPYLRPMVPVTAPQPIINLDPAANWPQ